MQIGCGFQFVYKTVFRQRRRAYRLLECRHESDFQDHYHIHREKHPANTLFASTRSTILSRQWLLPRAVLPDCYLIYADLIKKIIPLGTFFTYAVSLSMSPSLSREPILLTKRLTWAALANLCTWHSLQINTRIATQVEWFNAFSICVDANWMTLTCDGTVNGISYMCALSLSLVITQSFYPMLFW